MNKIGIIVNADDFGRHELINGAFGKAAKMGLSVRQPLWSWGMPLLML